MLKFVVKFKIIKKCIWLLLNFIFSLHLIAQTPSLKVVNNQTMIPLNSSYWIVGDSVSLDSLVTGLEDFYRRDTATIHFGFTAQQVDSIFPNLVGNLGNRKAIDYVEFVPILVQGMQEQQRMIDTLKKTNDSLNLQIQNLRQEIANWKGRTLDTPSDNTRLFQNNPNPFDGQTTISYFIDENTVVNTAVIEIRDIMGGLKSSINLDDRSGIGSINYDAGGINPGYYIYTLKINGSIKDSKMFLKE